MSNQKTRSRNYNKPTKELALEQIYASTEYQIPANRIIFGTPTTLDQFPIIQTDENTFVPAIVDKDFDSRIQGDGGFLYQRLPISVLNVNEKTIPLSYPFKVHDILPLINATLRVQLTEDDVVNEEHLVYSDTFSLKADPKSLMWIDSIELSAGEGDLDYRLMEDGSVRLMEDDSPRLMEEII